MSSSQVMDALWLSVVTCLVALLTDLVVGLPLAILLARQWRGVRLVRILVALPLSVPPVVAGLSLLMLFGRKGAIGSILDAAGWHIAFTPIAVVMSQVFVSLPFLVLTIEAALRSRPGGLEEMAASLGARPTRILSTITLPLVLPGIARGSALALARCLGEFGATLTFAGSLQGVTRTMPLEVYLARESDANVALTLGLVLLVTALIVVTLTEIGPLAAGIGSRENTSPGDAARSGDEPHKARYGVGDHPRVDAAEDGRAQTSQGGASHTVTAASATPAETTAPGRSCFPSPAPEPLSVHVSGAVRARDWELDLSVPAGHTVAIMGHNGSGKSTLAALVAGSLSLDSGRITLGDEIVDGPQVLVPSSKRRVCLLGQQPLLFPHMSVVDNVAFPLRCRGVDRRRARDIARAELAAFDCAHLAERPASGVSGGEAARIGLARALAANPGLLLLDEPTAALDVAASARVIALLAARLGHEHMTTLVITHDVTVALALADRLVVLENGRIAEDGVPARVLAEPTSDFGARLAGLNVASGRLHRESARLASIKMGAQQLAAVMPAGGVHEGQQVSFLFDPEAVTLHQRHPEGGSPRSVLPGTVVSAHDEGGVVLVKVAIDGSGVSVRARITTAAWAEFGGAPGVKVWCAIKATQIRVIARA